MKPAPVLIERVKGKRVRTLLLPAPIYAQPIWNRRIRDWATSQ